MKNDDAKIALLTLFQCYNISGTDAERKAKFNAYWMVLEGLGPEKIVEVCSLAMRGDIGNSAFMPSAADLYQAARPRYNKPAPRRLPGQDRFLTSSGTLFVDGLVYSAHEVESYERGVWPPRIEPPQEQARVTNYSRHLKLIPKEDCDHQSQQVLLNNKDNTDE
jgi:hypothetical protein